MAHEAVVNNNGVAYGFVDPAQVAFIGEGLHNPTGTTLFRQATVLILTSPAATLRIPCAESVQALAKRLGLRLIDSVDEL